MARVVRCRASWIARRSAAARKMAGQNVTSIRVVPGAMTRIARRARVAVTMPIRVRRNATARSGHKSARKTAGAMPTVQGAIVTAMQLPRNRHVNAALRWRPPYPPTACRPMPPRCVRARLLRPA